MLPIDGCFATSGVNFMHTSILLQFDGIGDYRCFVLDLTLTLFIKGVFSSVVTGKKGTKYPLRLPSSSELQQCTEPTLWPPPYVQEAIGYTRVLAHPYRIGILVAHKNVSQGTQRLHKVSRKPMQDIQGQPHQVESQGWSVTYQAMNARTHWQVSEQKGARTLKSLPGL